MTPKRWQPMLSQVPDHFTRDIGLDCMIYYADMICLQAEMVRTTQNKSGELFAGGKTPWAKVANAGVEPWAYFDAALPNPACKNLKTVYPDGSEYRDPYWLRRAHCVGLRDNQQWTTDSFLTDRPYTNAADPEYLLFLFKLLRDTGIRRWMFDDGGWLRKSDEINEGWRTFYRLLRKDGHKVIVNGAWEPGAGWTYPMLESVDGMMIEAWVRGRPHFVDPDTAQWRKMTDTDIERICIDWTNEGKMVVLVARWEPEYDPPYADYDAFCLHYQAMAERTGAVFCPAKWNYFTCATGEWAEEVIQPPPPPVEEENCCDEIKQMQAQIAQIDNYLGACLDEVETMKQQMIILQKLEEHLIAWATAE